MFEMAETFTKHMFHYVPDMPFEVTDDMGMVLNGGTDWHHVPLQDGIMQYFWHEFVSDTELVTEPGANIFLDGNVRSPAELAGLNNLLLFTSHPEWEADLASSPVSQVRVDLCYSVNQARESVFSMRSDRKLCQFFTTFLHKELASTTWILFGEDITLAANTARLAANGPGRGWWGRWWWTHGCGCWWAGHGPQRVVVSLSDEVQSRDRELAVVNDEMGPDRVHVMQRIDESRLVLEDSAHRGGSVADRWDWLGKNLDIDTMVYRVVISTSLWGKVHCPFVSVRNLGLDLQVA
jgi:hypothetical protein